MSEELSKSDARRVRGCDHYLKTKQVMKNAEVYKELAVGEVYFIKHKNIHGDKESYISAGWNDEPAKFMVFHKDEDFVFVKRIIASGKMGKEVVCLNTTYDIDTHWLEADPDFVNSILLEDEAGYDPLAASKKVSSNKNKARRRNKKLEIGYDTNAAALEFIKTLKVGDLLYDAGTAYGSGMITWEVTSAEHGIVDPSKLTKQGGWGRKTIDDVHSESGFLDIVEVKIKVKDKELPKSRRWENTEKLLTFQDFAKSKYSKYYKTKPYTIDDV